jgi:hypothetical protein
MSALDTAARSKGRKTMEAKLSSAAKAARRLSAGPRLKRSEVLTKLAAIARVIQEMARAEVALAEEGLTPADCQINLVYKLPATSDYPLGLTGNIRCGHVPVEFFQKVDALGAGVQFLGILTLIADHENGGCWPYVKPFIVDTDSLQSLAAFVDAAKSGKIRVN